MQKGLILNSLMCETNFAVIEEHSFKTFRKIAIYNLHVTHCND